MNPIWIAFITGLTTGGISCLAVQGGLLTAAIAQEQVDITIKRRANIISVFLFITGKLLGYSLVGFVLGFFGSVIGLSLHMQGVLQIVAGTYMLVTAANIVHLHPVFRRFFLQPPKGAYRFLKKITKSDATLVTPFLLGFMTILIPCGVTQMMMAAAVATANPILSALILGAFVLGTSPLFFILGSVASIFMQKKVFSYITAACIVYFAILSVNGGLTLLGTPYTLQNFYKAATTDYFAPSNSATAVINQGKQEVVMSVSSHAYQTNVSTLKASVPVKLTLKTENAQGCIRAFTIPSLNLTKILPENGTTVVEFTPTTVGKLAYSCNMGMYSGSFDVIN
jgi:uncharacterized protein